MLWVVENRKDSLVFSEKTEKRRETRVKLLASNNHTHSTLHLLLFILKSLTHGLTETSF